MTIFRDPSTAEMIIRLGSGDIGVLTLDSAETHKSFGVGFRNADRQHVIGEEDPSVIGKSVEDVSCLVRLEFTDSRSIDVVIKHLQEVKDNWGW